MDGSIRSGLVPARADVRRRERASSGPECVVGGTRASADVAVHATGWIRRRHRRNARWRGVVAVAVAIVGAATRATVRTAIRAARDRLRDRAFRLVGLLGRDHAADGRRDRHEHGEKR